jgi:hypothetical protein
MKNRIIIAIILASLFIFTGSSPWEGAAAVAPQGELPATGFFVATNSFPPNTVVDITNIETNRSTRAIVANALDTPGLLAVVSREAADLIGMRPGSINRIRMVQPTDPIAFMRFTEGLAAGNPVFDSGNIITEERLREEAHRTPVNAPQTGTAGGLTGPSYVLEPEWRRDGIVTLPHGIVTQEPPPAQHFFAEPFYKAAIEPDPVSSFPAEEEFEFVYDYFDYYEEIASHPTEEEEELEYYEEIASFPAEEEFEFVYDYFDYYEEVASHPTEDEMELEHEEIASYPAEEETEIEPAPEHIAGREFSLVSTEERPPEHLYGIDPAYIIPGITSTPGQKEPEREPERTPIVPGVTFSVPRVSELQRGSFYVQLAAFNSPDAVENVIRQIDSSYNPVIYNDCDTLYRILLGPLNQGESAAVLQRFRSIGFRDAFVRRGG